MAPGQIFLFGEHAVVHGQPALATAIDIHTKAEAELLENEKLEVKSEGVGKLEGKIRKTEGRWEVQGESGDLKELSFVIKVLELTLNHIERGGGLRLSISSDLPTGSGLGSSSAVTTATAAAVSSALGESLSREKISQLAFEAEKKVQGAASRTGVNVAVHGGFLKIQEEKTERLDDLPKLDIIIGYTGDYGDTGKLVERVKELRDSRPGIINPILNTIGKSAEEGIKSLQKSNLRKVGTLMNANQTLLEGLRVSSPKLRNLIQSAREAGAIGAKLTGAGGGGCMIALSQKDNNGISEAIQKSEGRPIETKIGVEGLKY